MKGKEDPVMKEVNLFDHGGVVVTHLEHMDHSVFGNLAKSQRNVAKNSDHHKPHLSLDNSHSDFLSHSGAIKALICFIR